MREDISAFLKADPDLSTSTDMKFIE